MCDECPLFGMRISLVCFVAIIQKSNRRCSYMIRSAQSPQFNHKPVTNHSLNLLAAFSWSVKDVAERLGHAVLLMKKNLVNSGSKLDDPISPEFQPAVCWMSFPQTH